MGDKTTFVTMLPEGSHSLLSASGSERWLACPGSVAAGRGLPDFTTPEAAEGTVAHHLAELALGGADPDQFHGHKYLTGGHVVPVTGDMLDAIDVYVRTVRDDADTATAPVHWRAEPDLTAELAKVDPDLGGHADCELVIPRSGTLKVYDYKHGIGEHVDVEGNRQLMAYALGTYLRATREFPDAMFNEVEVVIVQPRSYQDGDPVRRTTMLAVDMMDWIQVLKAGADATRSAGAPFSKGDHCQFCPARGVPGKCPEMDKLGPASLVPVAMNGDQISTRDLGVLADTLGFLPAMKKRIAAIEQTAHKLAVSGVEVPGYKLVNGRTSRVWTDKAAAEEAFRSTADAWSEPKEAELKSVAQVEKAVGKKAFKETEEKLVLRKPGALTLVPESDKRLAQGPGSVKSFEALTQE